jgi:hypothetical protein
VLLDSIAAEFSDGRLTLGRGVPDEWLESGPVELRRFPIADGGRVDVRIEKDGAEVLLELAGDTPSGEVLLELPQFLGRQLDAAEGRCADGRVAFSPSVRRASVRVGR